MRFVRGGFALLTCLFATATNLYSSRPDSLFLSDDIINIELRTDFSGIQETRTKGQKAFEGELIYYSPNGKPVRLNVKVESRGNFRRNPEYCKFPPLLINFRKNQTENTLFLNQNKLKLVTPCHHDDDVIEEYLIYRMYNKVSDMSFRVRLVNILYYDTNKRKKLFERYSFFIESEERVAFRIGAYEISKPVTPFDLERESYKRLSLFQYMIGNKDWYVSSRKNIVVVQQADNSMHPVAIPYDFDFAGFVNADYTRPKGVPLEDLAERRVFKGICYSENEFMEAFDYFRTLKEIFYGVIEEMNLLSKADRSIDRRYLDEFYRRIEENEMVTKEFMSVCETRRLYNLPD